MVSRKRDDDEAGARGFLSRWSERKRSAEAPDPTRPEAEPGRAQDVAAREAPDAGLPGRAASVDPADLPDIDSLEAGADFSVFLRQGVPRALQRRALRRLWQVDPAFSEICMLDDYNLDYTDAATVVPNLKTLYQVGRGMVLGDEDAAEDQPPEGPQAEGQQLAEADSPEGAAGLEATPAPRREPPHKPGTPRVSPAPTPQSAADRPVAGATTRGARERRWGDPGDQ